MSSRNIDFPRVLLALAGFFGAVFAPPWMPIAAMALLALRYPGWEVPLIGLLMDFLWLPAGSLISPLPIFTIAGIIVVWGLEPLRREFLLS